MSCVELLGVWQYTYLWHSEQINYHALVAQLVEHLVMMREFDSGRTNTQGLNN